MGDCHLPSHKMKISLQYCIPSMGGTGVFQHQNHDSSHPNGPSPYFLARRTFSEPREVVMFTLHLLQMEFTKYVSDIFPPSVSAVSAPDLATYQSPLLQEEINHFEKWPHWRIWSDETEKELTIDSLHSHDSVADFCSSTNSLHPLSTKDLEGLWESQDECHQNSGDGNVGNSLFSQISANLPFDNPNPTPTHFVPPLHHFPISIPDSSVSYLSSSLPQQISDSSPSPLIAPMPIGLQFTINSFDNDLLIQGRHGIGSFDVNILSDDLTRISLSVSGQLMNVTFATLPNVSSGNERVETCHIHLDIVSLALGYRQAIQRRSERGSDDVSGETPSARETSLHDLSPRLFEDD